MSKIEGETLDHVLPDLADHLDLDVIIDKLLSEHLIETEVYEQLLALLSSGSANEAVRKTIIKIKRNRPGYLAKFITVLKSKDKTKHFGDMIERGNTLYAGLVYKIVRHDTGSDKGLVYGISRYGLN